MECLSHYFLLTECLALHFDGSITIYCNDASVDFLHATATHVDLDDILGSPYVPLVVRSLFVHSGAMSHEGRYLPLLAVQICSFISYFILGSLQLVWRHFFIDYI
ncbi:hypothetical protein AMTRI_Chr13g88730 [Amborella trichopoda]